MNRYRIFGTDSPRRESILTLTYTRTPLEAVSSHPLVASVGIASEPVRQTGTNGPPEERPRHATIARSVRR
jgi:hypothetical protein